MTCSSNWVKAGDHFLLVRIEFVGIDTHLGTSVGHPNSGDEAVCPDVIVKGPQQKASPGVSGGA